MPRIACAVEYDGTDFSGSQFQLNARSVQGELEAAARLVLKIGEQRIQMASRTDAGVHAQCQVVACNTPTNMQANEITSAMNANLPRDVAIRWAGIVSDNFNPRRDAINRAYDYTINTTGIRSPFRHKFELVMKSDLDVDLMDASAQHFVGTHDFASFAAIDREDPDKPTTRTVEICRVVTFDDPSVQLVRIIVIANSFLRQQVRRMAGLLIAIGSGNSDPTQVRQHLANPIKGAVSNPAPALGLTLGAIKYPPGTLDPPIQAATSTSQNQDDKPSLI